MDKQNKERRTEEIRERVRVRLWTWANTPAVLEELRKEASSYEAEMRERIESAVLSPKPPEQAGMPGGNLPGDPTARAAHQVPTKFYNEQIWEFSKRIEKYREEAEEIEQAIMQLPGLECMVIRMRYKEYHKETSGYWEKIAHRIHTSVSHAKKLEGKACDRLAEALKIYSE